MELNQVNIYPKNYHRPDLVITYTLKEDDKIDMFKMWISDEEKENIEIIDYANRLLYGIIIQNERTPIEKDVFYQYQVLFHNKRWRSFDKITTKVKTKQTLAKTPYFKYKELTKDYLSKMYEKKMKEYIKLYQGEDKDESN